jgi:hypothetical protein
MNQRAKKRRRQHSNNPTTLPQQRKARHSIALQNSQDNNSTMQQLQAHKLRYEDVLRTIKDEFNYYKPQPRRSTDELRPNTNGTINRRLATSLLDQLEEPTQIIDHRDEEDYQVLYNNIVESNRLAYFNQPTNQAASTDHQPTKLEKHIAKREIQLIGEFNRKWKRTKDGDAKPRIQISLRNKTTNKTRQAQIKKQTRQQEKEDQERAEPEEATEDSAQPDQQPASDYEDEEAEPTLAQSSEEPSDDERDIAPIYIQLRKKTRETWRTVDQSTHDTVHSYIEQTTYEQQDDEDQSE